MSLRFTIARKGLLGNSRSLLVYAGSDCRTATYRNQLFSVFLDKVSPSRVRYAVVDALGGSSGIIDANCESHQGTPAVFVFNGSLCILASGTPADGPTPGARPVLATYDPSRNAFQSETFRFGFHGTPSLVEYGSRLYLFFRAGPGQPLRWASTEDLKVWSDPQPVLRDGDDPVIPRQDPVACVYQGLIHLFHDLPDGLAQIRFDGASGWSRSRTFIARAFQTSPAVVVHDGLLTLACVRPAGRDLDTDLHLYRYDGNALGLVDVSFALQAVGPAAAGVLNGTLYIFYPAPDEESSTSSTSSASGQGDEHAR